MENQQQQNYTESSQMPDQMSHGGHELFDAHEAIGGLVGALEHSVMYEQYVQDPELKQIMTTQKNYLSTLYNTVVETLKTGQEPAVKTKDYNMATNNNTIYGMQPTQPKKPAQSVNEINDASISDFLMGHVKACASHFTVTALETSNPVLRRVFADSVPNLIEIAFELYLYQNKHHYYQVPQLKEADMQIYKNSFAPIQPQMPH
ncbi:spore coat protein [Oceanobacillus sp. CAU 1775]